MANTGQGPSDRGGLLEVESDQERAKRIGTFSFVLNAVNRRLVKDCCPLPPYVGWSRTALLCMWSIENPPRYHGMGSATWTPTRSGLAGERAVVRAVNDIAGELGTPPHQVRKESCQCHAKAGRQSSTSSSFFANPPSHAYFACSYD